MFHVSMESKTLGNSELDCKCAIYSLGNRFNFSFIEMKLLQNTLMLTCNELMLSDGFALILTPLSNGYSLCNTIVIAKCTNANISTNENNQHSTFSCIRFADQPDEISKMTYYLKLKAITFSFLFNASQILDFFFSSYLLESGEERMSSIAFNALN